MSLWVIALLLAVMAACRLTRLVTHDDITTGLRLRLARRGDDDLAWRLIRCPWCIGFWISLACVAAAWLVAPLPGLPGWYTVPAEALACSHLVGLLAGWTPED